MNPKDLEKQTAARRAVEFVENGMLVGLGSGSTAAHAIREIATRVRQGLRIQAIPTSRASADLAREAGIELVPFDHVVKLDITIDGADEIAPGLQLIKGGGGALLHEKIVAAASKRLIVIADSSKLVARLGAFPLPVEVVRFGWPEVAEKLQTIGASARLRLDGSQEPFVTEEGNYILDCRFYEFPEARLLAAQLDVIPGLVEHGLFLDLAAFAIIARGGETELIGADK